MTTEISKFAYAMSNTTTTNGAVSLATPDPSGVASGRLSLFFKSVRGLNTPRQYQYMKESSNESIIDAFLLSFHIRDCRGGKGERELGRRSLIWLFINYPNTFAKVIELIPEYGRWDDLIQFFPGVMDLSDINFVRANYVSNIPNNDHLIILRTLQDKIVDVMGKKIYEDHTLMLEGKPVSLVAKWAPSEGDSTDRKYGIFKTLASSMNISPRDLRKIYLTPLRSYLKIVERFMCDREWGEIDYNKVPSCAMKRLKKSFERHDEIRFQAWRTALSNGDPKIAKVNAKQLQPHELIKEMRTSFNADGVCKAQWKIIEEECLKQGSLDNDLVVVDTSGSMQYPNFLPLDVSCAMGLLIAKCSVGKFKNNVITFSTRPTFHLLKDVEIYERYRQLVGIEWGGSTDINATFKLILERAKKYNLTTDDMPKRLWIISDMQFNIAGIEKYTNFEMIDEMYKNFGFTRPQIIFWNVVGSTDDFPVSVDDNGTAMISGFSTAIMKSVLEGDNSFSPYNIMRKTLDDKRLKPVKIALGVNENM
jgi:hypothetical protein